MGRPGPRALDAPIGPVRAHLAVLQRTGASPRQIAELADVNRTSIRNWMRTTPTRRLPVLTHIRSDLALKVLRVTVEQADAASDFIDAGATRRRLCALATVGWTPRRVGRTLGVGAAFTHIIAGRHFRVRKTEAAALRDHYDRLAFTRPPLPNREARQASERAAANARALGWPGPLDWEDIEAGILDSWDDDDVDTTYVDEIAVDGAIAGQRVHLTHAERDEAIRRLRAAGRGPDAVATLLGLSGDTYAKIISRLDTSSTTAA